MPANVVIRIGASAGQAVREIEKVNSALGDQMSSADKASNAIRKAAVPAAIAFGAVTAVALDAARAAMKSEASQAALADSLKRSTGATDDQVASTRAYLSELSKTTTFAGSELRPALAQIATATGDIGKAQTGLALAMDLSAKTGKDLATTSNAVSKAYAGQALSLGRLVPGIDKAALKSADFNKINQAVADVAGGAAADAAATQAGQMEILQHQVAALKVSFGKDLLPVMGDFVGIAGKIVGIIGENKTAFEVLGAIVFAFSGAILAANAALKVYAMAQTAVKVATAAWTAVQWLLNAALNANPIGLVIIAVAALAAGIIYAYKHSETFRNVCTAAFNAVKVAVDYLASGFRSLLATASSVWTWIKSHWQLAAFAFGPLGVAILLIAKHFDTVKAAGVGAFNAITAAIRSVIGWIQSAIDAVSRLIGALGNIHVPHISIPHIGGLEAGGAAVMRTSYPAGQSGGPSYTINVSGAFDPEGTARAIRRVLESHERRQGRKLR
jgi:phage-related protein